MGKNRLAVLRLLTAFLLFLFTTLTLYAQEPGPAFTPPVDIVLVWAKRLGLILTILAAGLILYTFIFRGQQLMEPSSKWLLFFGLCALPFPVLFLSSAVGLEQSKDVSFCNHCHVMDPFINDMKDPTSQTLTALHYRNRYIQREQCWACHSDYGIFGTAEAKLDGLVDVYKYATNTFKLPIQMRHPYRSTICLDCHAESALFKKPRKGPDEHDGVLKAVLSNEAACTDCHDSVHPPRERRSTK